MWLPSIAAEPPLSTRTPYSMLSHPAGQGPVIVKSRMLVSSAPLTRTIALGDTSAIVAGAWMIACGGLTDSSVSLFLPAGNGHLFAVGPRAHLDVVSGVRGGDRALNRDERTAVSAAGIGGLVHDQRRGQRRSRGEREAAPQYRCDRKGESRRLRVSLFSAGAPVASRLLDSDRSCYQAPAAERCRGNSHTNVPNI